MAILTDLSTMVPSSLFKNNLRVCFTNRERSHMEHINCKLCYGSKYKVFNKINSHRLVKCKKCGLVYLNPRPNQKEIDDKYSAEYHIGKLLIQEPKTESEIEDKINRNTGMVTKIVKQFGTKGNLLDIGCSTGFFLACLQRYGWQVTGVDISEWASNFAREKLGLNVFTGTVGQVRFTERFDVVTMYHILEHLPNPLKTLKGIPELMADRGVLIIKGPNLGSFDRMWHGEKWRGYDLPFHLYHFTPKTYSMILDKAGFTVQEIIFEPWRAVAHLKEMGSGDGLRADHPPDIVGRLCRSKSRIDNSPIFKIVAKTLQITSRLLSFKGRDLTIHAKKKGGL